jgi:hypothetical protein
MKPKQTRRPVPAVGDGHVVLTKRIPYTDFPLAEIKLYFTDGVILLPSEY